MLPIVSEKYILFTFDTDKSSATLLTLANQTQVPGVRVNHVHFCEAQTGKCVCDRKAAVLKAIVRRALDAKRDCVNMRQFFKRIVDAQPRGFILKLSTVDGVSL